MKISADGFKGRSRLFRQEHLIPSLFLGRDDSADSANTFTLNSLWDISLTRSQTETHNTINHRRNLAAWNRRQSEISIDAPPQFSQLRCRVHRSCLTSISILFLSRRSAFTARPAPLVCLFIHKGVGELRGHSWRLKRSSFRSPYSWFHSSSISPA